MIIVDDALKRRAAEGRPIRVGMIGGGTMGRATATQIIKSTPGMALVAIANRTLANARRAYVEAGSAEPVEVATQGALEDAIRTDTPAITDDFDLLVNSDQVDAILELTGTIDYAARAALATIAAGKHFITLNAELDGTIGPLLKHKADAAGVVYSVTEGDQPGVLMNLVRFARMTGFTPLVCGNVKGLQDRFRTPETQKGWAEKWKQGIHLVTSAADGTKISFEQAIVANATDMRVEKRGMVGREYKGHVDEMTGFYDLEDLKTNGGVVDYVVGPAPAPGVFVFATHDDPSQKHFLELYKMGPGPLYSFYAPYHLCHMEIPISVARAVLFHDTVLASTGPIRVEVVATAKTDLKAGQTLDGLGGFLTYGEAENAPVAKAEGLLPMGLAEGCVLTRDVPRDATLTYADVNVPPGRLIDQLRAEQDRIFST